MTPPPLSRPPRTPPPPPHPHSSFPSSPVPRPSTSEGPDHKPPLKTPPAKGKAKDMSAGSASSQADAAAATAAGAASSNDQNSAGAASSAPSSSSKKRPSTRELHLNQYVTRDHLHAAAIASQEAAANLVIRQQRSEIEYYVRLRRDRAVDPGRIFGYGFMGYGNGFTDGKGGRVLYPCQRKRPGGRKVGELRLSRTQLQKQADTPELLVPVRLDVEHDKIRLRDTFTWNLHDQTVPLDLFAEQLVEDFHLPMNQNLLTVVRNSIQEQVTDYHPHVFLSDDPLDPTLPYFAYKNDDMRVLIKLNITIGQHNLVDQFEWDINNPLNSPEEFAQLLTREMSLSGEFTTAIAHSIREQCQLFTKALFVTGHPFDGRPIEDEDVRSAMLPSPMPAIFRPTLHHKDYQPTLYQLSEQDLERAEKIGAREDRRLKRRVNRRGGPTVPDLKEMPKTHRSQIVSSVLPGAVAKVSDLEKTRTTKQIKDGDSDEEESDSAEEETPEKVIPGYANMTRRQRMAAMNNLNMNKANAASSSAGGRSATPEVHQLPSRATHEPAPSSSLRRQQRSAAAAAASADRAAAAAAAAADREDASTPSSSSVANAPAKPSWERNPDVPANQDSILVRLRMNVAALRQWTQAQQRRDALRAVEEERTRRQQQQQQQQAPTAQMPAPSQTATKAPISSAPASSPPPAATAGTPTPAPTTPVSSTSGAPPPPDWLTAALNNLKAGPPYNNDRFEGTMRYTAFDAKTDQPIPAGQQQQAQSEGRELVYKHQPRIRCLDCPGKLYTTGPDHTVENFLMHLKNRDHRKRVEARLAKERSSAAS